MSKRRNPQSLHEDAIRYSNEENGRVVQQHLPLHQQNIGKYVKKYTRMSVKFAALSTRWRDCLCCTIRYGPLDSDFAESRWSFVVLRIAEHGRWCPSVRSYRPGPRNYHDHSSCEYPTNLSTRLFLPKRQIVAFARRGEYDVAFGRRGEFRRFE